MRKLILGLSLYLFLNQVKAQSNELNLIPYPQKVTIENGMFELSNATKITVGRDVKKTTELTEFINYLHNAIHKSSGKTTTEIEFVKNDNIAEEGYHLDISTHKIIVSYCHEAGLFYAKNTLSQLIGNHTKIPNLHMEDAPAYAWRGFMLDVSRHFFTIDYLKKTIDRMSFFKANKLHLHLTDDQGWRIEIKKYPLLTKVGAWRSLNNQDSACLVKAKENPDFEIDKRFIKTIDGKQVYGGFYTQAELKDLVKYAAKKHIEIIPEIDMPGHFNAAIRAYPQLTAEVASGWGKTFTVPISPCKENVYTFLQDVLKEVFEIFPSKYIHIGADEVEKTTWKNSDSCLTLMKEDNLTSVEKLQSYFVHRMQRFVEAQGRKLITWDDALEGGLNKDVTIMYWRNWVKNAPREAIHNGNDLIMSPNEPLYFDYQPNKNSINAIYNLKTFPFDTSNLVQFKGGQANLWTEMVPSERRADYLIYPRYLALAEKLWTNDTLDYKSFNHRLNAYYPILDSMQIAYRLPDLSGFADEMVFVGKTNFSINVPEKSNLKLHYTLDNSIPSLQSPILTHLNMEKDTTLKVAAFNSIGNRGDIYKIHFTKKKNYSPAITSENELVQGLRCDYKKGGFRGTKWIKKEIDSSFLISNTFVPKSIDAPSFATEYKGFIKVPTTDIYSFYLTCDDGGILKIDDQMIVDNDGNHSSLEKSGQAALAKGLHPFLLQFIEGGGGFTLDLKYSVNGTPLQSVPDAWFYTSKN